MGSGAGVLSVLDSQDENSAWCVISAQEMGVEWAGESTFLNLASSSQLSYQPFPCAAEWRTADGPQMLVLLALPGQVASPACSALPHSVCTVSSLFQLLGQMSPLRWSCLWPPKTETASHSAGLPRHLPPRPVAFASILHLDGAPAPWLPPRGPEPLQVCRDFHSFCFPGCGLAAVLGDRLQHG